MEYSVLKIEYNDAQWDTAKTIKTEMPVYTNEDITELDGLKEAFGRFLHFVGYPQFNNDFVFVESVDCGDFLDFFTAHKQANLGIIKSACVFLSLRHRSNAIR